VSDKNKVKELNKKIEAILIAIPKEIMSHNFYKELAEKSQDESEKEMFEYLAMQEKIHENKLKLLLKKLHRELESEKTKLEKN
jgi:rubrerythrin